MFNLKIANIERLLKQRNNSEIIQNTSQEIADYINSICQDNKKCEQYYFQQVLKLDKKNSVTLENIKNIKYQDADKISIKEEYKIFIDKLSREIRNFNKIQNLQAWVIKQLPNVLVEDYNEFFVDIKIFASLQDDERFQYKDITKINSPKELRRIVIPFVRSEIDTTTNNKEWEGEWVYNKDKISVFKSYDPETISQISKKYQTRWCIKNQYVAKNTYKCETQPMYFVFIGDNVVCVVHLESEQIKDVSDLALSDISIIKKIDPVLQELKLTVKSGDFTTYHRIFNRNKEISSQMDKLDSQNKIDYAKELLSYNIYDINSIDKNLIIYNKELQDIAVKEISDKLRIEADEQPLTISQDLYLSIPKIREIYLKFWEETTKDHVYFYVQYCPSYIGKEKVIQDSFIIGMEKSMGMDALNYLSFKGSYPEIINRHMDKFKQYINPCVKRMKHVLTNHPEDYKTFQESQENIPEIFNNPEIVKSFEEILINGMSHRMETDSLYYIQFKSLYPEIINRNMDKFKKYIGPCIKSMKEEITKSPETYKTYQESRENIPELFNNPEVVKSLDETLVTELYKRIKEHPRTYRMYLEYKQEYPEKFNNPEIIERIEESFIIGVENKLEEDPLTYIYLKGSYPEIINRNMDKFKKYINPCIERIKKEITIAPDSYQTFQESKENIPEIFNNPETVKSLEEGLVNGMAYKMETNSLNFIKFKELYPEIINRHIDKYKQYINPCIQMMKKEIMHDPDRYKTFKKSQENIPEIFNNPETVKSFDEVLIIGMTKTIQQYPGYYLEFQKQYPYIFENSETFKILKEALVTGIRKEVFSSPNYELYLRYKKNFPELFNNPETAKRIEEAFIISTTRIIISDPDYYFSYYKKYFSKIFNDPESVKSINESLVTGMENTIKRDPVQYLRLKMLSPETININMDKFKKYINPCVEDMKKSISFDIKKYDIFQEFKENTPEIFNNPEIVKSLEETLVTEIKTIISARPVYYFDYKEKYPEILSKPEIVKSIKDVIVTAMPKEILHDPSKYSYYKEKLPDIFNNPETVESIKEKIVSSIKYEISQHPPYYSTYKQKFPELFNNPEIAKSFDEKLVVGIKKQISQDPDYYSYYYKKYKKEFPDLFNNPEIIKSLEEALVTGIKNKISKTHYRYLEYKQKYPEIFNNPEIVKSLEEALVTAFKKDISISMNYYSTYKQQYPEIVKSLEETLVTAIKKEISQHPIYYSVYKQKFPEIFERYNILPPDQANQQLTTSNNWYKLFKSSKK